MVLNEAIRHLKEYVENMKKSPARKTACFAEHEQLYGWLVELRAKRRELEFSRKVAEILGNKMAEWIGSCPVEYDLFPDSFDVDNFCENHCQEFNNDATKCWIIWAEAMAAEKLRAEKNVLPRETAVKS